MSDDARQGPPDDDDDAAERERKRQAALDAWPIYGGGCGAEYEEGVEMVWFHHLA